MAEQLFAADAALLGYNFADAHDACEKYGNFDINWSIFNLAPSLMPLVSPRFIGLPHKTHH